MCHNPMTLWHTFQNDKSYKIITHQFKTKFWNKIFRCLAFFHCLVKIRGNKGNWGWGFLFPCTLLGVVIQLCAGSQCHHWNLKGFTYLCYLYSPCFMFVRKERCPNQLSVCTVDCQNMRIHFFSVATINIICTLLEDSNLTIKPRNNLFGADKHKIKENVSYEWYDPINFGTKAKKISCQKSLNLFVCGSELLKAAEIWKWNDAEMYIILSKLKR